MGVGVAVGGSRVLAGLIDKHGEAILSDFLAYYRLDLRELFSEDAPLSPRYVLALLLHLPPDGALAASRQGGLEYRGWDASTYALAAMVNSQRFGNHILLMVNRDPKKPKPKPPEPFPTPGGAAVEVKKPRQGGSFAAMAATMMAAQRRRKELMRG